jgi:hypothetical protein
MPSTIIEKLDPEKPSFRPSKWPRKLKTAKNSKLPKLLENYFEPVGKGGWPPISTWIMDVPAVLINPTCTSLSYSRIRASQKDSREVCL